MDKAAKARQDSEEKKVYLEGIYVKPNKANLGNDNLRTLSAPKSPSHSKKDLI